MSDRNPANLDPLTEEPGAHPVGTGLGAAGGAAAGAAVGAIGGPVGAAIGAVAGAVAGGLAGKGAAELVNPTEEDAYWRSAYNKEPYYQAGRSYDEYRPAYELGWDSAGRYDGDYAAAEPKISTEWQKARAASTLSWDEARPAVRAAWEHAAARRRAAAAGTAGAAGAFATGQAMSHSNVADVLNDLIKTSRDGQQGFEACAEQCDSAQLKQVFVRHAQECAAASSELEAQVRALGEEPSDRGSITGALHRGWVSLKTALTSNDDLAVLQECERGQDSAVSNYRDALAKPLPANVRALVQRQFDGVLRNHDEVRNLCNARKIS